MNIIEAIAKAKEFLLQDTGIDCDPDFARLTRDVGLPRTWIIEFSYHCYNKNPEADTVVDGGEIVIEIDYKSGETAFGYDVG